MLYIDLSAPFLRDENRSPSVAPGEPLIQSSATDVNRRGNSLPEQNSNSYTFSVVLEIHLYYSTFHEV